MKIRAWTVCVGPEYAAMLEAIIPHWLPHLQAWIVVTSLEDTTTIRLCKYHRIPTHRTAAFTQHGAAFNKALALEGAMDSWGLSPEWNLLLDADIVPPFDWLSTIKNEQPEPGMVYGWRRTLDRPDGQVLPDQTPAGWFLMFHSQDRAITDRPLFGSWHNAGSFDSVFLTRWPQACWRWIPGSVTHLGLPGQNWCGAGNAVGMQRMREERWARGGWMHERLDR